MFCLAYCCIVLETVIAVHHLLHVHSMKTLTLLFAALTLPTTINAQVTVQGAKSAQWVPAGLFDYNGDGKPYTDLQYDGVPNHSWYYQVDIGPTFYLTGTGNNFDPNLTPLIPMGNLLFWGIPKGQGASDDAAVTFTVDSTVIPTFVGGHLFNNRLREIGVTSGGVDRPLFVLDGLSTCDAVNTTIGPGVWQWYVVLDDGRRKDGNQPFLAPFLDDRTGTVYCAIQSFSYSEYSGVILRLDPQ